MRRCRSCLTPVGALTVWCSPTCWRDDEGPERDNDADSDLDMQEERV